MVEPHSPALDPLAEMLADRWKEDLPETERLKLVEKLVLQQVPYEWDWNTWGVSDYLPTVAEVMAKGKEDCDGRAVVAASLLRRFGVEAELVSDFTHLWVKTPRMELMGPGKSQALVAGKDGLTLKGLPAIPLVKALAYGIGPFPLIRELIVVLALWLLLLGQGVGLGRAVLGLGLLVDGLLFLKHNGLRYLEPLTWMQAVGFVHVLGGMLLLWFARPSPNRASKDVVSCGSGFTELSDGSTDR
jgi:hypothetical protein